MRAILTLGGLLLAAAVAGCADGTEGGDGGRPSVVVTTTILGDIVGEVVGDQADISVVMPLGADPHEFAASTRQAEAMVDADLLVINGAGFEEGLHAIIEQAEDADTPTFAFADAVDLLSLAGGDAHGEDGDDPHLWTDPTRVVEAVEALAERVTQLDGIDAELIRARVDAYVAELDALDREVEALLAGIAPARRVLVTNHEVLGYFADRYGFEVVGAVIPSLTTNAEASAADLEDLAELIEDHGVPAIFAETTGSSRLADALAGEVGGRVQVVELFTESLGEPGSGADTYLGLIRTDAQRIADALA